MPHSERGNYEVIHTAHFPSTGYGIVEFQQDSLNGLGTLSNHAHETVECSIPEGTAIQMP